MGGYIDMGFSGTGTNSVPVKLCSTPLMTSYSGSRAIFVWRGASTGTGAGKSQSSISDGSSTSSPSKQSHQQGHLRIESAANEVRHVCDAHQLCTVNGSTRPCPSPKQSNQQGHCSQRPVRRSPHTERRSQH